MRRAMTVAEAVEELQKLPQYRPLVMQVGDDEDRQVTVGSISDGHAVVVIKGGHR